MTLLGLALAALIGVSLGFFGGGGSILTVPLLVYVFGLPPKEAIAASLLVVGIAALSGALQHARVGNVRVRAGLVFGAAGMAGAYLGGRLGVLVPGGLLLLLFAGMMVVTALGMWRGRRVPPPSQFRPLPLMGQGFAVGSFTGLVGAGGGFLIVPALALWAGLPVTAAIGTSLVVIVLNCFAGFAGYASHVPIRVAIALPVAAIAIGGSFLGSHLAGRVAPAGLRRAFAGFVLGMAVMILVRETPPLVGAAAPPPWLPLALGAAVLLGLGAVALRGPGTAGPAAAHAAAPGLFIYGDGI